VGDDIALSTRTQGHCSFRVYRRVMFFRVYRRIIVLSGCTAGLCSFRVYRQDHCSFRVYLCRCALAGGLLGRPCASPLGPSAEGAG